MHFNDSISRDLGSCIHTQGPYVFKTNEYCFNNHSIVFLISLVLAATGLNGLIKTLHVKLIISVINLGK